MSFIATSEPKKSLAAKVSVAVLCVCSLGALSAGTSLASAAELTRSVDVAATPSTVWSAIGAFCAIKDWHPAVGTCTDDGKVPPTRTLVTKDGKVTFVETQVARNDAKHTYSYNFVSSPFPVTQYIGTITVSVKGSGMSTITWHGTYTPLHGKEMDANDAFAGVYEAGLAALKSKFAN
jgi:uncharacterized protein YndB with AHSA1/START domain